MWPKIIIPKEAEKIRLDVFLCEKFPDIPRKFFQGEIKKGTISLGGCKALPGSRVKPGQEVWFGENFSMFEPSKPDLSPDRSIEFRIVFENENFAIIEKPSGVSVHPSLKELSGTLVNGLLAKFPALKNVGEDRQRPGIVHRLDKYTSGLMIVPINQKSFEFFKDSFQQRKIKKKYIAVCWGKFKQKEGAVDFFVGKSKSNPTKQATSKDPQKLINPKDAQTKYLVLEEGEDKSLVELAPKTGRKHQIRIHMHCLGHPLVGDFLYDNKAVRESNKSFHRFMLHANQIEFIDQDGEARTFVSELPSEFEEMLHQKTLQGSA